MLATPASLLNRPSWLEEIDPNDEGNCALARNSSQKEAAATITNTYKIQAPTRHELRDCSSHSRRCCSSSRVPASGCCSHGRSGASTALLGARSVAMAIGLEISKPFAIWNALASLRRWRVMTAAALAFVGTLAVAYSLQAELMFMSATRGDLVAERAGEAGAVQRAEERYR